jgi:hypothetical protein
MEEEEEKVFSKMRKSFSQGDSRSSLELENVLNAPNSLFELNVKKLIDNIG